MDNDYLVRGYHGTGKWYTTNGEYIPKPNMPRMDNGWLGGEFYVTEDLPTARDFYMEAINEGRNPALLEKDVVGFDLNPKEFIDLDKPLSKQSKIVQNAVEQYRLNNPNWIIDDSALFFNADGSIKELPKYSKPEWNKWIDSLRPYGVKGWHDNIDYTGDKSTYVFRHIEDVPKGISLSQGTDLIPELPDLVLEENLKKPIDVEYNDEWAKIIDNALKEETPKLSTPARNINKQTPKPRVQVKQPTITPKQVDVPIGARLYEAGLNPKELAKLAKDPKVLSEVTKSLSKAITNPKTYLELGRGLVSPTNIGLIASDILVNKADQAVHNRLKGKYNIKSQAEFNKLYPTLSTFERGQLGNTYPEMYQTYMKGR